jgi:hypothetical protein
MALRTPEEVRDDLRAMQTHPNQWVVVLETAEYYLNAYGAKTLAEFVTNPYSKGGLGLTLEQAKNLAYHNPSYKHKADAMMKKLGIAERAKAVPVLNAQGRPEKGANLENSTFNKGSTAATYRIAKLKRDHPEIAARLEEGEFKNVIEAERAAGVKPEKRPSMRCTLYLDDPEGSLKRAAELLYKRIEELS